MRSIALGLNLGERFFDDKINEQCHNLRLLSYPPVKRTVLEGEGQARAGAHSGSWTVKLLFSCSLTSRLNRLWDTDLVVPRLSTSFWAKYHHMHPAQFNFSAQVGGLEVQNPHTGQYVPATPIVRLSPLCSTLL